MMTKKRSTKIVNFMTPRTGILVLGGGHISYIVKMHYFFKNLFLSEIKHTKNIVMLTKERYTKVVNFMTPQDRGSCAMAWPNKSYSEIALFVLHVNLLLYTVA